MYACTRFSRSLPYVLQVSPGLITASTFTQGLPRAVVIKSRLPVRETWALSGERDLSSIWWEGLELHPGWEDPRRRQWQPTPGLLPGEFHGQGSLVGYSPWGRKELNMTEQVYVNVNSWIDLKWQTYFLVLF